MAKSVIKEGKNVDDAIAQAIEELGIELEDADIEVIEDGKAGVLNLFGGKSAKVKVTEHVSDTKKVTAYVSKMLEVMGIEASIEVKEEGDKLLVDIYGEDVGALIGRHGETLYAMSYLANLIVNKGKDEYKRVVLDVENYRKQRETALVEMAERAAQRVIKYKKPIKLQPMPATERRVVHAALQANRQVETESIGEEPYRCIVVKLRPYTKVI